MRSISLSADAGQARSINVFWDSREHVSVHSQIVKALDYSLRRSHRLRCEPFAHLLCLLPALRIVYSARAVVASFPANCDRRVKTASNHKYNEKVYMQAA